MYKEEVLVADPETAIELSDFQIERNKPIPNIIHGYIQAEISFQLKVKYDDKYLVVSELSLDTQPSSTPDICICEEQSLDVWAVEPKAKTPPLTTVEIISPSQSVHELMQKARELYFPVGVKSAWLVVPEWKTIQVYLPDGTSLIFDSGTLKDPTNGIEHEIQSVFKKLR